MSTTKANERKKIKMLLRDKDCFTCVYHVTKEMLKNMIEGYKFCVYRKNRPKYGVCLKHQQRNSYKRTY